MNENESIVSLLQEVQAKIDARRGIEKCVVCGKNLLPGDQFCRDCGAPR